MRIYTGTYTGTGVDDRAVTIGFQPTLIIVKSAGANEAIFRTSTMAPGYSAYFATNAANATNLVKSLTSTGFTVGTDASVNSNGVVYRYIAIGASGANYNYNNYTGTSNDNENITGAGFQPTAVFVKRNGADNARWKTTSNTGEITMPFAASAYVATDDIQAFIADGFQVGTDTSVNFLNNVYYWFTFKDKSKVIAVGQYTGNGTDNTDITAPGFTPDVVFIKRDGNSTAVLRTSNYALNYSSTFTGADATGMIKDFITNGFRIGTNFAVNKAADKYTWIALKNVTTYSKTITSDSYIKQSDENTLNSNSYIKKASSGTILSDNYIKKLNIKTITSDAWIREIQSEPINSNSNIKQTYTKTINSNSYIKKPGYEGSILSDMFIGHLAQTKIIVTDSYLKALSVKTINSNSYIKQVYTQTINSNFYIKKLATEKTITSDYIIKKLGILKTIISDANIKQVYTKTINSNSIIKKLGTEGSIISDIFIGYLAQTETIISDIYILKVGTSTLNSNSNIEKTYTKTLSSDDYIKKLANENTLNSNSNLKATTDKTINSNAQIKKLGTSKTINSDAYILKEGSEGSIPSDLFIGYLGQTKTINSNANIKKLAYESIISNSYIKKLAIEGTINSNANIKKTDSKIISSDSYIKTSTIKTIISDYYLSKPGSEDSIVSDLFIGYLAQTKTAISNSCIKAIDSNTIFLDFNIKKLGISKTIVSDIFIGYLGQTKTINSNAQIKKVDNENTINSNSYIKRIVAESIISNSFITIKPQTKTINSDMFIKAETLKIINSDSYIQQSYAKTILSDLFIGYLAQTKTITSDSYIKKADNEFTIFSDAQIKKPGYEGSILSDMFIGYYQEKAINANSHIKFVNENTISSNSKIKKLSNENTVISDYKIKQIGNVETLTSDSYILASNSNIITSDMFIGYLSQTKTINSDMHIKKLDYEGSITSNYEIGWRRTINSNYKIKKLGISKTINCDAYITHKKILPHGFQRSFFTSALLGDYVFRTFYNHTDSRIEFWKSNDKTNWVEATALRITVNAYNDIWPVSWADYSIRSPTSSTKGLIVYKSGNDIKGRTISGTNHSDLSLDTEYTILDGAADGGEYFYPNSCGYDSLKFAVSATLHIGTDYRIVTLHSTTDNSAQNWEGKTTISATTNPYKACYSTLRKAAESASVYYVVWNESNILKGRYFNGTSWGTTETITTTCEGITGNYRNYFSIDRSHNYMFGLVYKDNTNKYVCVRHNEDVSISSNWTSQVIVSATKGKIYLDIAKGSVADYAYVSAVYGTHPNKKLITASSVYPYTTWEMAEYGNTVGSIQVLLDNAVDMMASTFENVDGNPSTIFFSIFENLCSDAYISKLSEKTITSDMFIGYHKANTINSNYRIKQLSTTTTINSNSKVKQTYGGKPLSTAYSSLVSLYRMNEPSWSGIPGEVADGKGVNSGAAMGAAATTQFGLFNRAGIFSGTNTGVNCGSDTSFHTNHASVNVWVYPTAATNSYNDIINSGRYRVILRSSKYIELWAYSLEAGWIQAVSNSAIDLNKWTLITCTYDGTAKLYINGILQTTIGTGGGNLAWAGNTIYLAQSGGNTNEFIGKLDDIGFWNVALTQSEITNIWKQFTFLFTDSYIKKLANENTLNSNSSIKKLAIEKTLNSNSFIKVIANQNTLNSNAKIARIGVTKTITSDAWIGEFQSETINSNSNIKQTYTKALSSNAIIKKPGTEGALNSDYYIKKLDAENTINSDSYISKSQSNTLDSNSYINKLTTETLSSDYYIKKLDNTETLASDSYVEKLANQETIVIDSYIKKIGNAETLTTDSYIKKLGTENTLTSDSYIKKLATTKTLTSDSCIKIIDNTKTITSDGYIIKLNIKTIDSNYIIKTVSEEGSIDSNAQIKKLNEQTLTSDALIKLGGQFNLTSDYVIMEYGVWSEEWEVEIVIPRTVTINSNNYIKVIDNTETINSNAYVKRADIEGALTSDYIIIQSYTKDINSIYYIRRTDQTKPYVYTAKYINKPIILSANTLSYTETMI